MLPVIASRAFPCLYYVISAKTAEVAVYFTDRGIEEPGERHDDGGGDPVGCAMDRDWQRNLTVWALAGLRPVMTGP